MTRRHVDLSHAVVDGEVTYPGLPAPSISDHLTREASRARYAPGFEFHIGRIEMVANTGTYLDTPFHRFEHGYDLSALPLHLVAGVPGVVVDGTGSGPIELPDDLAGRAVLVRTGWDVHWATPRYGDPDHPSLHEETARHLVAAGVGLVGIDSVNIDDTSTGERPIHSLLLEAGIPIVEHLTNLGALPDHPFDVFAVPVKVVGMGTFPVRAFAMWDEPEAG
ncbi:MAG TPA: cyclase family protein [Acidimicrobiales bacterium]|nr:cyclase family protein [Acidimicrobiales bacterium]